MAPVYWYLDTDDNTEEESTRQKRNIRDLSYPLITKNRKLDNQEVQLTMEIGKLIDLVKDNPALYNKNHKSYTNNEVKMEIWKVIGRELHISAEKCKYKWKGLRTQYAREKEMWNLPSGSDLIKKKEWKYFKMMKFLDNPRATHTNVFEDVNPLELDDTMENFEKFYNDTSTAKRSPKSREHSRDRDSEKSALENSVKCFQNLMTEITRVEKEADDEVDLYFKSIAKIVKDQKLTSLQFLQLQGKLTYALKTELENMQHIYTKYSS